MISLCPSFERKIHITHFTSILNEMKIIICALSLVDNMNIYILVMNQYQFYSRLLKPKREPNPSQNNKVLGWDTSLYLSIF